MTGNDPLDNEVSVSAELTPNGVTARARSRFVSSIDRLGGNLADWANVRLEAGSSLRRAKIRGEERLVEAAVQYGIERLGKDAQFAERALQQHFRETLGKHANREAVIEEAIADLRRSPPTEEQSNAGSEQLDSVLLDRIANYADSASSDALREKWGRVIAAEVRSPGVFSLKVLRLVDELEPEVARLFEDLCEHRIVSTIPLASFRTLSSDEIASLDSAGLLIDPGLGQTMSMKNVTDSAGGRRRVLYLGRRAISAPWETGLESEIIGSGEEAVEHVGDDLQVPVYVLTSEAVAIASMLPNDEDEAVQRLAGLIRKKIPGTKTCTLDPATQLFRND